MENIYEKISKCAEKFKFDAISDLIELCKIPSVSTKGEEGCVFGKEVKKALEYTAKLFSDSGFSMEEKNGAYAIYKSEKSEPEIGIFSHADVVPVNCDWIKTEPFSPIVENGYVFGRGTTDDKSGVIMTLYALKILKEEGIFPKSGVTVFVGGSEETGMQDLSEFLKSEKVPKVNLVPDGSFPVSIGEKGLLRVDALSNETLSDITEFCGGNAYNVVLDNVEVNYRNKNPKIFKGITAHASMPEGSLNAAVLACEDIISDEEISEKDKAVFSNMKKAIEDYYGKGLGIESMGEFGKLTAANGIVRIKNGKLFFTVDIRYGNEVSGKDLSEKITEKLKEYGFSASINECDDGFLINENSEYVKAIISSCEKVTGKKDLKPLKMSGATYSRYLGNSYSVMTSVPFDLETLKLPAGHGNEHQSDEAMNVQAFIDGIKALSLMIYNIDKINTNKP